MPTVISAVPVSITMHLRTRALVVPSGTLLMAATDHDGLCVCHRRHGDNYERCDH